MKAKRFLNTVAYFVALITSAGLLLPGEAVGQSDLEAQQRRLSIGASAVSKGPSSPAGQVLEYSCGLGISNPGIPFQYSNVTGSVFFEEVSYQEGSILEASVEIPFISESYSYLMRVGIVIDVSNTLVLETADISVANSNAGTVPARATVGAHLSVPVGYTLVLSAAGFDGPSHLSPGCVVMIN